MTVGSLLTYCLLFIATRVWAAPAIENHASHHLLPRDDPANSNSLTLQITDADGKPANHLVEIYHANLSSNAHLQKRSSRQVTCAKVENGIQYEFLSSWCSRPSAVAWYCARGAPASEDADTYFKVDWGTCEANEICVDGIYNEQSVAGRPSAYCVSMNDFVNLVGELAGQSATDTVNVPYRGAVGGTSAVEVVFTGANGVGDPLTLSKIEVDAQKNQVGVNLNWQWVTTKQNLCTQCTSLGIQPVPEGTSHFSISAQLPVGVGKARMYWTAGSY